VIADHQQGFQVIRKRISERQILHLLDEALPNVVFLQFGNILSAPDQGWIFPKSQTESSAHNRKFAVDRGIRRGFPATHFDILAYLMRCEARCQKGANGRIDMGVNPKFHSIGLGARQELPTSARLKLPTLRTRFAAGQGGL
jgi:hypothetical protein